MKDNLNYKIIKNVLNEEDFNNLYNLISGEQFPWFMGTVISYKKQIHFAHFFLNDDYVKSPFFNFVLPILKKLNAKGLKRIKANIYPKTNKIIEHGFHTDYDDHKNLKTAIFYCNSNNGYTKFKNEVKIKSINNTLISFDSNEKHTGSTCTDEEYRIIININYYE
jgi:hypothetical protein